MKKKKSDEVHKNKTKSTNNANRHERTEDALRKNEKFFKEITENSSDIIIITDENGDIKYCSPSIERFSGYKPEEVIGKSIFTFINPDEVKRAADEFGKAIMMRDSPLPQNSFHIIHKDGSERYFYGMGKILLDNPDIAGVVMNIHDITERTQAEEALKDAELKFRTIFNSASDGILIAQCSDRKFSNANKRICQMLGYTEKELLKMSIYDIHPKESLPYVIDQFEKQLREEVLIAHDIPVLRKDGTVFFADVNSTPIILDGKESLLGLFRDITERKQNEENLRQREEELYIKSQNLEEMNTALKVLLKQREEDRIQIEENVLTNMKTSILPYIEKLKKGSLTKHHKTCLKMLEGQMKEIISPFLRTISQSSFDLTPQELRVADLVKNGNTTKEIAGILRISIKTVDYHRDNLRRKLGIKNNKTNLRSFLLKFS
jgi:PAS domain S-box-containing protein